MFVSVPTKGLKLDKKKKKRENVKMLRIVIICYSDIIKKMKLQLS